MLIYHEAPIEIFEEVQENTGGDYALVHLLESNPSYRLKFLEAKCKGRTIMLDNSIFELGEAYDVDRFAHWIKLLEPDWYIVPDALEDKVATLRQFLEFTSKYATLPGGRVGVLQGKTYEEIVECYQIMEPSCDMIAVSFDYSMFKGPHIEKGTYDWYAQFAEGRQKLLQRMLHDGVINEKKPHHLLGCMLPQEFGFYNNRDWEWIMSCDTSNPVVHGMVTYRYSTLKSYPDGSASVVGLTNKCTTKLCDIVNEHVHEEQREIIMYNIREFRSICNG